MGVTGEPRSDGAWAHGACRPLRQEVVRRGEAAVRGQERGIPVRRRAGKAAGRLLGGAGS